MIATQAVLLLAWLAGGAAAFELQSTTFKEVAAAVCKPDGTTRQVDTIRRSEWLSCKFSGYCISIGLRYDSSTGQYVVGNGQYEYSSDCDGRQYVYYERSVYADSCGDRSEDREREVSRDACM